MDFTSTMAQVTRQIGMHADQPHTVEIQNDRTETFLAAITQNLHESVSILAMRWCDFMNTKAKVMCNLLISF